MPENWEVIETTLQPVGGTPCYYVRMKKPNGDNIIHVMPQRTIDFRAAEYDIDASTLAGKQQILDMILHEPHMDPIEPATDPTHLYSAPTVEAARTAHLARVEAAKSNTVNIIWSGNPRAQGLLKKTDTDPAQMLLDHPVDDNFVNRHKDRVFMMRAKMGLEKRVIPGQVVDPKYYDPAVRRRGLTVALLDTPQE